MKKDSKERLFEVMGRLDKTFTAPKPKLNEEFEPVSPVAFKQPEMGDEEKIEQTPEEKLEALTAKVDELYALLHGESEEPKSEEEPESEEGVENLQEWNFDKKKGDDDTKEHEESETPAEEKAEHEKGGEEFGEKDESVSKPKIPINAIAKVGK